MLNISSPTNEAPLKFINTVEEQIFNTLAKLDIPFERVDNDPAITMDDCREIDRALNVHTAKTLLLTNRQQTKFYLLAMSPEKPFVTRDFSRAMGIARVSFAPEEVMLDLLGTERGAATLLSAISDSDCKVSVVIDKAIAEAAEFGCTAATVRCYLKIATSDLLSRYLPFTGHDVTIIDL